MTEKDLQNGVIQLARLFGWRVAHFRPAQTSKGWRTPVQADGKGFPDLVMVHKGYSGMAPGTPGRLIFAELKANKNQGLSADQELWRDDLGAVATVTGSRVEYHLWTAADWPERITEILSGLDVTVVGSA